MKTMKEINYLRKDVSFLFVVVYILLILLNSFYVPYPREQV